jgi:hypothetical protein
VRCPILIGREESAALIAEAVTRLAGPGRGGALVVTGEAGYLADHADEVPVALLATARVGDGRDDVPAVLGAAGAQVCPIGRLTGDEVRAMVAACTGPGPMAEGTVTAVVHAAEGLPLLVEDLLVTGDLGALPPRFAHTVRVRPAVPAVTGPARGPLLPWPSTPEAATQSFPPW